MQNPFALDLADYSRTGIRALEKQRICRNRLDTETMIATRIRAHIDNPARLADLYMDKTLHGFRAIVASVPRFPHLGWFHAKADWINPHRPDQKDRNANRQTPVA